MKTLSEILNEEDSYVALLVYCLSNYDEMLKQLNDELDNCNYFGE